MTHPDPHPRQKAEQGAPLVWLVSLSGRELRDQAGRIVAAEYRRGIHRIGSMLGQVLYDFDASPAHRRACELAQAGAGPDPVRDSLRRLGYLLAIEPPAPPTLSERITLTRAPLVVVGQGAYVRTYDPSRR